MCTIFLPLSPSTGRMLNRPMKKMSQGVDENQKRNASHWRFETHHADASYDKKEIQDQLENFFIHEIQRHIASHPDFETHP